MKAPDIILSLYADTLRVGLYPNIKRLVVFSGIADPLHRKYLKILNSGILERGLPEVANKNIDYPVKFES